MCMFSRYDAELMGIGLTLPSLPLCGILSQNSSRYASINFFVAFSHPFLPYSKTHAPLSVKLGPLDINPIILHCHSQVLHRQHRPALPTSALSTSSKSTPLHPELDRLRSF